ncbi:hypothetical protein QYF36_020273 [Acer negundo]|nr:hypothetical protein QYF36_020273 [Acer negundo]
MARLAVGEALANLVWAKVTSLSFVKASGNWMYAAKLDEEGAAMYDAATSLSEDMIEFGIATHGGKDSLSKAAHSGCEEAPGNLVISVYVTCPDITKTVTLDLKLGDGGIDLAKGKRRLGGSALAQAFVQIWDESPNIDDVSYVFGGVQDLIADELISAGLFGLCSGDGICWELRHSERKSLIILEISLPLPNRKTPETTQPPKTALKQPEPPKGQLLLDL